MKTVELNILAFGIAKDIIGKQTFTLDVPETSSVEQLKSKLYSDFPELQKLKSLSIAVNNEYVAPSEKLKASDEIALIPPVSGG